MGNYDKVVVFKLGNHELAADIMQIDRILNYINCSAIPHSPEYVEGVINYDERVIPVISLKSRLGLEYDSIPEDSKIIVINVNNTKLGFVVDNVSQVLAIEDESVEPPPEVIKANNNNYIHGIIRFDDRIIIFIDMDKLLTTDEIMELSCLY